MNFEKTKFVYVNWQNDYEKYVLLKCQRQCQNVFLNNCPDKRSHGLQWFLYKIHMSPRTNKLFNLPLKRIWNHQMIEKSVRKSLSKDDKIVFIFSGTSYRYIDFKLTVFLKKTYPNSRTVYIFSDKVMLYQSIDEKFSIEKLKQNFDAVISYNNKDAERYSLIMEPFKPYDFSDVEEDFDIPLSDVFYVGKDKGRLVDILQVFEIARASGLKCDFTILGVPNEKRVYSDEIEYERRIPYLEMLKRVKRSKSILNIMQDGADGITLRDYEAFGMNKILITNSEAVKKLPNYQEDMVIELGDLSEKIYKLVEYDTYSQWKHPFAITYKEYYELLGKIVYQTEEKV